MVRVAIEIDENLKRSLEVYAAEQGIKGKANAIPVILKEYLKNE